MEVVDVRGYGLVYIVARDLLVTTTFPAPGNSEHSQFSIAPSFDQL